LLQDQPADVDKREKGNAEDVNSSQRQQGASVWHKGACNSSKMNKKYGLIDALI